MKLFVTGRKETFAKLKQNISDEDAVIWVHAASLGEFEQGLPLIEKLKKEFPSFKIVLTFFSPSGYEIKKDSNAANVITYLPFDTKENAKKFIQLTKPKLAVFIKYEIWPNYINELNDQKIPTILSAAIFSKNQVYFKWYGGFMRNALKNFTHIFIQNKVSKHLLNSIDINTTTIAGDTRLDRVSEILESDNSISYIENFKNNQLCIVAGSTWQEDEKILIQHINNSEEKIKYIIAPHKIKKEHITALKNAISKKTILYSEKDENSPENYEVLVIDSIGLLTKIYSYADIAYVGGGFATGLHNTLEPAVFGIPVLIGPNYKGFQEAEDLVQSGGIISINDDNSFEQNLNTLLSRKEKRQKLGEINSAYIRKNKGASIRIVEFIRTLL